MVDTEARGVKEFCRTELGLDPAASADARLNVAKVMAVWMTATARIRARNEQDSTANTSNLPKVLPKSEHLALRAAFEASWYRLEEKATPSAHLMEVLEDMFEQNKFKAVSLKEVTSM